MFVVRIVVYRSCRLDYAGSYNRSTVDGNVLLREDAGIRLSYKKLHVLAQRDEMLRLESEGGSSGVEDEEAAMIGKMKNPVRQILIHYPSPPKPCFFVISS